MDRHHNHVPQPISRASTCKGCGHPVLWAVLADGTRIPLDRTAPVYVLSGEQEGGQVVVSRHARAYVSHFSTCRDADAFSGKKTQGTKKPADDIPTSTKELP